MYIEILSGEIDWITSTEKVNFVIVSITCTSDCLETFLDHNGFSRLKSYVFLCHINTAVWHVVGCEIGLKYVCNGCGMRRIMCGSHVKWNETWSWNKLKCSAFGQKGVIFFWQTVDAILEDIVWCKNINQKTSIFQCVKIYSDPTNVTKYKVAVNMVNPKSLLKKCSYP